MLKNFKLRQTSTFILALSLLALPQTVSAQTFKFNPASVDDCDVTDVKPPPNRGKTTTKPPKDKIRKKFAIESAEKSLNLGYNYFIISPVTTHYAYDIKEVVIGGGAFSAAEKVKRKYNHRTEIVQKCRAIDDYTAMHLIWQDKLLNQAVGNNDALEIVNIRDFVKAIDSENPLASKPWTPKIWESHYANIGDRERITRQYPVMLDAAKCRGELAPQSLSVFKRNPQLRNKEAERQCLETYRADAAAVDWADFPLVVSETASTVGTQGYVLNRPKSSPPASGAIDSNVWGKGWKDISANLKTQTGTFLYSEYQTTILLASNDLDETSLIDHAVFLAAAQRLNASSGGFSLQDETPKYRESFEDSKKYLLEKLEEKQKKQDRQNERERNRSSDHVSDRDIEYKERDIADAKERIANIRTQNDDATIAQMKASLSSFPGSKFDEQALRKQLQEVRNANIAGREQKLRKLETDLELMKTKQASAKLETLDSNANSGQTINADVKPSLSANSELNRGVYHAFENYSHVFVVSTGPTPNTCHDYYLVCADKLQAYNALGPRIGKAGFTPFSPPTGYRPYEPN